MTAAQDTQIAAIFVLFITSIMPFAGMIFTRRKKVDDNPNDSPNPAAAAKKEEFYTSFYITIIKGFSSGIIFGVAVLHLLVDGDSELSPHFKYPGKT